MEQVYLNQLEYARERLAAAPTEAERAKWELRVDWLVA